jgi:hypothetical protein
MPGANPSNMKLPVLFTLEENDRFALEVAVTTAKLLIGVILPFMVPVIAVSMVLMTGFRL